MPRFIHYVLSLFVLTLAAANASANGHKVKTPGGRSFIYRYYLIDKQGTPGQLDQPQTFLSKKSVARRQRQHLPVDSTDLPVSPLYLREMAVEGVHIVARSRWQNTVTIQSADSLLLASLAHKPFVKAARLVYVAPDSVAKSEEIYWNIRQDFNRWDSVINDPYGMARPQIEMLHGEELHTQGLKGQGMTIAVLDAGFMNYDKIPALSHAHIVGTKDFVQLTAPSANRKARKEDDRAFHAIDHGTRVLSAIAAYAPEVIIGTAPKAGFWLLRSEASLVEQPVEEDFWTAAAEFADSVGVDIINSSLGYNEYDGGLGTYHLQDLDGKTAFVSISASMLARKGIVLCNSAGNSGMGQWKKIGVPADAHDILTVGAIDAGHKVAAFSSVGPSQDDRVKPDVVALGAPTQLISGRGALAQGMGTSFSTPVVCGLVACLWQGLPHLTAVDIIELVRQSADSYQQPTNVYGYGVPNFWQAYQKGRQAQ